tara:strand:- start:1773 stop:2900 length:1128 start_codon:yes stop_codon:yes gene_type:complete
MVMNADFSTRLQRFIEAAPGEVVLNAGFMDRQQFSELHTNLARTNRKAARSLGAPGSSDIERGFGAIVNVPSEVKAWSDKNAMRFGLDFENEWYVTPLGHRQKNLNNFGRNKKIGPGDFIKAAFGELHYGGPKASPPDGGASVDTRVKQPPWLGGRDPEPLVESPSPHGANPQLSEPQEREVSYYAEYMPAHTKKPNYSMPTSEYLENLRLFRNPETLIKDSEGKRIKDGEHIVYLDGLGNKTGGHGHLITEGGYEVGDVIPIETVNAWFEADHREHEQQARADLIRADVDVDSLSPNLYMHLVDFVFNQGSFRNWPTLLEQIKANDWEGAAANVWSDWFTKYENETGRDFKMGDGTYDRKLRLTLAFLQEEFGG